MVGLSLYYAHKFLSRISQQLFSILSLIMPILFLLYVSSSCSKGGRNHLNFGGQVTEKEQIFVAKSNSFEQLKV